MSRILFILKFIHSLYIKGTQLLHFIKFLKWAYFKCFYFKKSSSSFWATFHNITFWDSKQIHKI